MQRDSLCRSTIIVAVAGAKVAVRVVPVGSIDLDRAFSSYPLARSYAEDLWQNLGDAALDDRCDRSTGGGRG